MVVPTAAGGGADTVGRILAARLAELLGQPVIIENVGNAVAANNRVAKGMPDGYQFVLGFTAHQAFHPTLYKTPVYNPRTDFAPVALVVEQPFLLVTRIDFPASNLQEFAAYAKAIRPSSVRLRRRHRVRQPYFLRDAECGYWSEGDPRALSGHRAADAGHDRRPHRLPVSTPRNHDPSDPDQ
jgi:hypothetical protein